MWPGSRRHCIAPAQPSPAGGVTARRARDAVGWRRTLDGRTPGVTQRLAAVHRPLRDLGPPVPVHPRRRARAAAAGARLLAHGAGGAPAPPVRAAPRRDPPRAAQLAVGAAVHGHRALHPVAAARARRGAHLELAGGTADRHGAADRRRAVPRVRGGRPLRRAPAHRALRRVRRRRRPGRPRHRRQRRAGDRRDDRRRLLLRDGPGDHQPPAVAPAGDRRDHGVARGDRRALRAGRHRDHAVVALRARPSARSRCCPSCAPWWRSCSSSH